MADKNYQPTYHRSHALLIGIDTYSSQFPPLATAVKGVQELAAILRDDLGFDNVITLENDQATQRNIRHALTDPFTRREKVGPNDRVVIYFAGHGVTFDTAVGEVGHLVPVDADPEFEYTMVAMDELTKTAAERIHAKHVLFLLDACFSGFATTRMAQGVSRQVADFMSNPVRQVITAGTRDQAASDLWGPGGHSLFTGFLLEGIQGAAPMPGGVLRAFHLAGYLQDAVATHSRSLQTPQFAQLMGSRGGDFILAVHEVDELPPWVTAAADSQDTAQRMVAVSQLRDLALQSEAQTTADQALARLELLANDDEDFVVRSSAQAALRDLVPEPEIAPVEREEPVTVEIPTDEIPESPEPETVPPTVEQSPIEPVPVDEVSHAPIDQPQQTTPAVQPRSRSGLLVGGGLLIGSGLIGVAILAVIVIAVVNPFGNPAADPQDDPTDEPTVEITEEPSTAPAGTPGVEPVTGNDDWEPVIEEIGDVEMALVPAGCFMMGSEDVGESDLSYFEEDELPAHEVCFEDPFWIDVYEVTNERFGSIGCESSSSEPDQPRNCVSWTIALTHCSRRGARLPTEAEWEYAARGPDGLIYPWGNTFEAENVVYKENNPEGAAPVGSKPGGVSWVGAYDLSGNMWEWVNDWYSASYFGTLTDGVTNPQGPDTGTFKVMRGGSWSDDLSYVRAASRFGGTGTSESYFGGGFRCALSYSP